MGGDSDSPFGCFSCFKRQDRFFLGNPGSHFEKSSRVLEGFDVGHDDACVLILTIIIDDFIHAHVSFVPETRVHPYPLADPVEMDLECLSHASALGHDRDIPRKHGYKGEIGIDRDLRIRILNSLGVGAVNAHAVLVGDCDDLPLQLESLLAHFFEASRVNDGKLDPFFPAVLEDIGNESVFDRNIHQVDFIGNLRDRCIGFKAFDVFRLWVHGIDGALKIVVQQVFQDDMTYA